MIKFPEDVPCPLCRAERGASCARPSGRQIPAHIERLEAFHDRVQTQTRRTA